MSGFPTLQSSSESCDTGILPYFKETVESAPSSAVRSVSHQVALSTSDPLSDLVSFTFTIQGISVANVSTKINYSTSTLILC